MTSVWFLLVMEVRQRVPTLHDRLVARLLAWRLDRALAAGALPGSSPALALRARRLTAYSTRLSMAKSLRLSVTLWNHSFKRDDAAPLPCCAPS